MLRLIEAIALSAALWLIFLYAVFAQHAPSEAELHNKFYSTWMRPDMRDAAGNRMQSCCGNSDCYPTRFKIIDGHWWFMRRLPRPWLGGEREDTGQWVEFPDRFLESNQPDPRESPDGQSHVCDSGYNPFCAVLGAQN